jgi:hypothetical protein
MIKLAIASASALLLSALVSGCVVHVDDDGHYDDDDHVDDSPPPTTDPYLAVIDRGQTLSTTLGEGAALFVEYAGDGEWTLWTSCDTLLYGASCVYDVYVSSQAPISDATRVDLEGDDYAEYDGTHGLYFGPETSTHRDALTFVTEPGALIQVDVFLDGLAAPAYLIWHGEGVVQNGAPFMPVLFLPDGA